MKSFYKALINTLIVNVTNNFLWFALVFWAYLETRSVLATGVMGGAYMLLVAISSVFFGTWVDSRKKKMVFVVSSVFSLVSFSLAGVLFVLAPESALLDITGPLFWVFVGLILAGGVVGNARNIALSTLVTLLVPKERRANANGLVGTITGVGFIATSVFSGLAIGFLGMGRVLGISIVLTAIALIHAKMIDMPEGSVKHDPELAHKKVDLKGSMAAILAIPGLFGLIVFSTFNNLIGGVYMALMGPYGLTIFSVQVWGILFGVAGTGFVIGGMIVAKWGLGKNPLRTLLYTLMIDGLTGAMFTIREWWWLFALGMWLYMILIPVIESAEQTIIQRVVPYEKQGRVFGFAQSFESAAAPVTAFLVAPIAESIIIPYSKSDEGRAALEWIVGTGEARGIALVFLIAGVLTMSVSGLAFLTKSYKKLSAHYARS